MDAHQPSRHLGLQELRRVRAVGLGGLGKRQDEGVLIAVRWDRDYAADSEVPALDIPNQLGIAGVPSPVPRLRLDLDVVRGAAGGGERVKDCGCAVAEPSGEVGPEQ